MKHSEYVNGNFTAYQFFWANANIILCCLVPSSCVMKNLDFAFNAVFPRRAQTWNFLQKEKDPSNRAAQHDTDSLKFSK